MKYVALVYYQESLIEAMTEQQWHDLNQECVAGVERLTAAGKYITGQALQPTGTATTVRVRNGETKARAIEHLSKEMSCSYEKVRVVVYNKKLAQGIK